jgi:phytoene synthase
VNATLTRSYDYCQRLARRQARNFYYAFRILPGPQRRAMCALYAFMRLAVDLTDGPGPPAEKQAALSRWREQLDLALMGQCNHPLHEALQHTIRTYAIPRTYLDAVLDGCAMDLVHDSYATFADLYQYCYRVASAVGLACIHIWGFQSEEAKVHAESAGIAFQLTNILRDLREDALRDRVYVPQDELQRFGYTQAQLLGGERDDHFRALMRFQVNRARRYYEGAGPLAALLPRTGHAVFQVMMRTYGGLLDAIEERDYDVFSGRVSLSHWRKLGLVFQAMPARWGWK